MYAPAPSASTMSTLGLFMSVMLGLFISLPTIEIQATVGLIALGAFKSLSIEIENFTVLLLFLWWIKDMNIIGQCLVSLLLGDDDGKYRREHPPWLDPAPYLPNGGSYGYSMMQYYFKQKSGHASPKHGGYCKPITYYTPTH